MIPPTPSARRNSRGCLSPNQAAQVAEGFPPSAAYTHPFDSAVPYATSSSSLIPTCARHSANGIQRWNPHQREIKEKRSIAPPSSLSTSDRRQRIGFIVLYGEQLRQLRDGEDLVNLR